MSRVVRTFIGSAMLVAALASPVLADPNGVWVALPNGNAPPVREGHVMVYDPVGDRLIVHGGVDGSFQGDLWAYPLATNGPWIELAPTGRAPAGRAYHAATWDPVRQRILLHGGLSTSGALGDLWALDLSGPASWDSLAPGGAPPSARYWHSLVDDPVNDRAILFGGTGGSAVPFELQLGSGPDGFWVPLASDPSGRCCHEAAYDSATFSMVMFGGFNGSYLGDLWAFNDNGPLDPWRLLLANGPSRTDHVAVIDRKRHRLVTFGGHDGSTMLNDVWAAALDAPIAWTQLAPTGPVPERRIEFAAIYDAKRDRMIVFGGRDGARLNDLWALDFSITATIFPVPPPQQLAIERLYYRAGALLIDLALPGNADLGLEVIDVTGRRIAQLNTQASAQLRMPVDAGSGVYFVRVRQGAHEAHGRVAIVR